LNLDRVFNIGGMIVVLAIVTTVVAHKQSAAVISSIGKSFSGSIRAAMGK